ncbi:MAG TPA: NAD(P)-dependent oxidoreductase [Candidatus Dormibacteraeota bacterium]|nr:NAD(P)-dependent oxidoreductase [Candidatus Dormibacteraeota bacterium]
MTVLVTGAGGFVGSQVVRQLVASEVEVAAMVRPGHPQARLEGLATRVDIVEADLDDADSIAAAVGRCRPEACIHAAWYAEPGKYLPSPRNLDSLRSSLTLLEVLGAAGCRHVVGVGTCFEYDMQGAPLRETSPTRPFTLYAAAKLAFMLIATQRAPQLGMGFAWARLFYLYGPFEDERRLMPQAIKALGSGAEFRTTAGDQVRDYLHVEDVAAGLCALSRLRLNGAFNVSSGEAVTIAGLMQTLGELLGRPELIRLGAFPPRDWDPAYICGDSTRLRTEAHWSPRYTLRDGLAQTIAWWKSRQ